MTEAEAIAEIARLCTFEVTELYGFEWGWFIAANARANVALPVLNYYLDRPASGSPCAVGSENYMDCARLHIWSPSRLGLVASGLDDDVRSAAFNIQGPTRASVEGLFTHATRELGLRASFHKMRYRRESELVRAQRAAQVKLCCIGDFERLSCGAHISRETI